MEKQNTWKMFSHHSHSGDYVAHGVDSLESIIAEVKRKRFHTYCLTEHMPRLDAALLYPEEVTAESESSKDLKTLEVQFLKYLKHAAKIKEREKDVKIIIGMEIEGCNEKHAKHALQLMKDHQGTLKFMVGSVHHVNDIPIDFDKESWFKALDNCGNNLKALLMKYFETQRKTLELTRPLVVGHFDLIRLFLPLDLKIDVKTGLVSETGTAIRDVGSIITLWPDVRDKVIENLRFISSYSGLIEINSAGLRKNLVDPYPHRDIIELSKTYTPEVRFVLSDDAHSVAQVGICYDKLLNYVEHIVKLKTLSYLSEDEEGNIHVNDIEVSLIKSDEFWDNY